MKTKIILMLLALLVCSKGFTQEIFETKNTSVSGTVLRMKIKFTVYADSLIMEYTDVKTIKSNEKNGLPNRYVNPYKFEKKQTGNITTWTHTDESIRIIINKTGENWVLSMTTKDNFTGKTTEILYY